MQLCFSAGGLVADRIRGFGAVSKVTGGVAGTPTEHGFPRECSGGPVVLTPPLCSGGQHLQELNLCVWRALSQAKIN